MYIFLFLYNGKHLTGFHFIHTVAIKYITFTFKGLKFNTLVYLVLNMIANFTAVPNYRFE